MPTPIRPGPIRPGSAQAQASAQAPAQPSHPERSLAQPSQSRPSAPASRPSSRTRGCAPSTPRSSGLGLWVRVRSQGAVPVVMAVMRPQRGQPRARSEICICVRSQWPSSRARGSWSSSCAAGTAVEGGALNRGEKLVLKARRRHQHQMPSPIGTTRMDPFRTCLSVICSHQRGSTPAYIPRHHANPACSLPFRGQACFR